jgi:hypothetical protein
MSIAWQTVHVRVNDAATGRPTPVRLRLTDGEGNYFTPLGRLAEFATGRNQDVGGNVLLGMKPWAYIDGACEVRLPSGLIRALIHKGPEYTPQQLDTTLAPGKLALRFTMTRWIDLRREGWYSGDTRAHFLTPHAALLEGAAEDLAVVNLLATECEVPGTHDKHFPAISNILAFSGQGPALERAGHLVVVNTHNSHPVLGSLGLLNCHRVVYPLSFGGPSGKDDWTLADWCDQCHRKGGLVVWTRTWHEAQDFRFGEPLADLILGKVDAFEIDFFEDSPFDVVPDWYTLLNAGLRVPLVGGSGKDSNGSALGGMRTYARLQPGEELTYKGWIEAVRAGRTFATNGPLLSFTVNGQDPGAVLDLSGAGAAVRIRAEARSVVPFERLEVIQNGAVIAGTAATGNPAMAVLETVVPLSTGGWLAARCRGEQQLFHRPANQRVFAHTSPVYVQLDGKPAGGDAAAAVAALTGHLERMQDWALRAARCDTDQQRQHLAGIFQMAREELARRGQ